MLHLKQIQHKILSAIRDYFNNQDRITVTWSCPKANVSGESWSDAIKSDVAVDYSSVSGSDIHPKFVLADRTDIEEAGRAVEEYPVQVWNVRVSHAPGWQIRRVQSQCTRSC